MTREEWIDYFETVNGRKPTIQEMAAAQAAGDFIPACQIKEAEVIATPNQAVTGPAVAFATVPKQSLVGPKRRLLSLWISLGVLSFVILSACGFIVYRYQSGTIEGTWYSNSLGKNYKTSMASELKELAVYVENGDITDYFKKTAVTMTVDHNQVKITASYTFNKDVYIKDVMAYVNKNLSWYGGSSSYLYGSTMEESLEKSLDQRLEQVAEDTDQSYDSDSGETSVTLLKGEVQRFNHKLSITKVNADFTLDDFSVKKNQDLTVLKNGKGIQLSDGEGNTKTLFTIKNDTNATL